MLLVGSPQSTLRKARSCEGAQHFFYVVDRPKQVLFTRFTNKATTFLRFNSCLKILVLKNQVLPYCFMWVSVSLNPRLRSWNCQFLFNSTWRYELIFWEFVSSLIEMCKTPLYYNISRQWRDTHFVMHQQDTDSSFLLVVLAGAKRRLVIIIKECVWVCPTGLSSLHFWGFESPPEYRASTCSRWIG